MLSDLEMQIFRMQVAGFIENWKSYGYKIGMKKDINEDTKTVTIHINLNKGSNDIEVSIILQTGNADFIYSDRQQPEFAEASGSLEILAAPTKETDKALSHAILDDLYKRLGAPMGTEFIH